MKKVVKFGGSSLAGVRQFKKVTGIIKADKSGRYVVPSMPDKCSDKNERVTGILYTCYGAVVEGKSYKEILEGIKSRYLDIIDGLNLNLNLGHEFERIEENLLVKAGRDYATSRGEYLDGTVTANYLEYEFIGAAKVTFSDDNGNFEAGLTNKKLSERPKHVERTVTPGFCGFKHNGTVKTFSRGSSDVAGFIVTKAIHADMCENWVGVSGVLITDLGIVDDPEAIETITYRELRELPYMGASILHEDAIFPVRKEGIPISIRNTNRPEDRGTLVVESTYCKPHHTITGIAGKKGFCSIDIERTVTDAEVGFSRKVLSIFKQYGVSFEHMPSSIDTMTVYVHQSEFEEYKQSVIAGIHRAVEPDTVELEPDLVLIAVVGRGMRSDRDTAGRVFSALAHARASTKVVDQGSGKWDIIIRVKNDGFKTAIRAICGIFVIIEL